MKENEKKISIALLVALVGFPQISETIYTPALPNIAQGLHASAPLVELTLTIYFLGFALGVLLWGTVSDIYGRRSALLTGLFIYGLSTLGCVQTESVEALLFWRFTQAFGASVGSVITQTILRDRYNHTERAKLFSLMTGALAFSPAFGPLLGGVISQYFGWRANFWALIFLFVVLFCWTHLTLPETRSKQIPKLSTHTFSLLFFQMIKDRILWGYVILVGATNAILFGFYQEAPFIFIEQLQIQPSHYGFFGLLIASATVVAARFSYLQTERLSAQLLIFYGTSCVILGGYIYTFMVLTNHFNSGLISLTFLVTTLFIIFFGIGLIVPNSLSHALKSYQKMAGTAGSIFGGGYYCFIALFTALLSFFHNGTALPLPLYITLLSAILIIGNLLVFFKKEDVVDISNN